MVCVKPRRQRHGVLGPARDILEAKYVVEAYSLTPASALGVLAIARKNGMGAGGYVIAVIT